MGLSLLPSRDEKNLSAKRWQTIDSIYLHGRTNNAESKHAIDRYIVDREKSWLLKFWKFPLKCDL